MKFNLGKAFVWMIPAVFGITSIYSQDINNKKEPGITIANMRTTGYPTYT